MPRSTTTDLKSILARKGYGIANSIGQRSISAEASNSRAKHDVEHAACDELEGTKGLQVSYAGKVCVSIKFYRNRLADYGEECSRAISEKSLIDCLQYAGLIRSDSSKEIRVKDLGQEKVASKDCERTEITIEYPDVDFKNLWAATGRTDGR